MTRRSADVTVECPCCGLGEVQCWIDPGEPMVMYYPDGSGYPGSPAGLDEVEATCECLDSPYVDEGKLWDAINDAAMQAGVWMDDDGDAAYEAARDEGRI